MQSGLKILLSSQYWWYELKTSASALEYAGASPARRDGLDLRAVHRLQGYKAGLTTRAKLLLVSSSLSRF